MIRYLLALAMCVAMFACSDKNTPSGIIDPEKMQDVLWDYIRADVFTTDFISVDSTKKLPVENVKLQKAIFEKYKISKEEFYNSYTYYQRHPDQMQDLLDSMIARKRRIPDPVTTVPAGVKTGADSPLVKTDSNLLPRKFWGRGRRDSTIFKAPE